MPVSACYKRFRKLPPSLIASRGQQFGILYRLWLGHSAEGVAEQYYVDYEDVTLDAVITWLHGQLFENPDLDDEVPEYMEPQKGKKKAR